MQTRRDYIVKQLCDYQHTLTRTTDKHYISYRKYNNGVVKTTKDDCFQPIKSERISLARATEQLIRNFQQLF